MAVITGGNIIRGNQTEGTVARPYPVAGAPVDGTTLDGTIAPGELVVDVDTGNVYEYTEPGSEPTFTRIDTV